jgi:hypothetical protein
MASQSASSAPKGSQRRSGAAPEVATRGRSPINKARERIMFMCAILILLFAPSDVYTLGRFSWGR